MRTLGVLAARDTRIDDLIRARFSSEAFRCYLREAFREREVPYIAASILVNALMPFATDQPITEQMVERWGVHTDADAVSRINDALLSRVRRLDRIREVVAVRLCADIARIPRGDPRTLKNVVLAPRVGITDDSREITEYLRIFLCALAMLVGLETEGE